MHEGSERRLLPSRRQALVVGVVVVLAAGITALVWPRGTTVSAAQDGTITVSRGGCGGGWTNPHGGAQTLVLTNRDSVNGEAEIVAVGGPDDGKVYGELDGLGVGTTADLPIALGPGTYAVRCVMEDTDPVDGPKVRIGGHATSNAGALPVTSTDLIEPIKRYEAFLVGGVARLVRQTDALDAAVRSGGVVAAKRAWLPAHLTYETLGAAYDAFGDYDGEINGTTAGLPDGVNDPSFTGFHRVEYDLWHGVGMGTVLKDTNQLDAFVHGLQHDLPTFEPEALDMGLRTHEIMENTLQFELTGKTDEGSGTNLATAYANATGDRAVLGVLHPLLATRYPGLSDVDRLLTGFQRELKAQDHGGTWTPVDRLPRYTREKINGTLGELVEKLAPIAAITEPRRTP
ncbi:MAG TPA: EfeM/EfeO family lipoprotein [Pseudonocardiaceae bacterium]|nr:EfeM/EfeO family lipoprotein [Pseudonocardiaceae bacterium]